MAHPFTTLSRSGNYSLPYLVKFYHETFGVIRLVNNYEPILFAFEKYEASSFSYTEPKVTQGVYENASLDVTLLDNSLIEFLETTDYLMRVEVVGVICEDGTVQKINQYKHQYGSASWDGDMKLTFSFGHDDRLNMQFPPYLFDADNNRGNA